MVVPSPATSLVLLATSRTICAPMFSNGSGSSISLATVTPSFVIVGDPHFLSRITFRPAGPRVVLTALDSFSTPARIAPRALLSYFSCLPLSGIVVPPSSYAITPRISSSRMI